MAVQRYFLVGPNPQRSLYVCDTAGDVPTILAGDLCVILSPASFSIGAAAGENTSIGGGASGVAWGAVTGTLSAQTDLQSALDGKAASSHTHAPSEITGTAVVTADARLSDARTPLTHSHPQSDVTGLVAALAAKAPLASPAFTGSTLTLADAQDLVLGTTTGTKVGQATSKIGFFGVTPVVRPTALTQTYATASATHPNVTQLAAPAGGTGIAAGGWSSAANRDLAIASINAARTDIAALKQFVNQIADQLQALGILA